MALPLYLSIGMAALVIILVIFGIFFFVVGIKQNPNLIIHSDNYGDSSKLLVILKTETQSNSLTVAELISLAVQEENYKTQLNSEISKLINKLPKPKGSSVRTSNWIFKINMGDETIITLGNENIIATKYLSQIVYLPLENKKLAKVELYLDCLGCSRENVDAIA